VATRPLIELVNRLANQQFGRLPMATCINSGASELACSFSDDDQLHFPSKMNSLWYFR